MGIKDILLHLEDSPICERIIDVALKLALVHGAQVTGLSVVTYGYYQPHYLHTDEKMAAAEALLLAKSRTAGVVSNCRRIESSVVGVGTRELLISASHCSDLIIVSQETRRTTRSSAIVEHLVTGAGRPILIVPALGTFPSFGKRVLVAWKNGREAARALHDALPILRCAEQVTLLTVAAEEQSGLEQWDEIQDHLQNHGVPTHVELLPATTATLADNLLNHSCEGGFDLLVMGAYQPGARRGSQLGAVAGQILREMTIPVLMSH
jgi:nucleotide-binding universal stress UspA family protein